MIVNLPDSSLSNRPLMMEEVVQESGWSGVSSQGIWFCRNKTGLNLAQRSWLFMWTLKNSLVLHHLQQFLLFSLLIIPGSLELFYLNPQGGSLLWLSVHIHLYLRGFVGRLVNCLVLATCSLSQIFWLKVSTTGTCSTVGPRQPVLIP